MSDKRSSSSLLRLPPSPFPFPFPSSLSFFPSFLLSFFLPSFLLSFFLCLLFFPPSSSLSFSLSLSPPFSRGLFSLLSCTFRYRYLQTAQLEKLTLYQLTLLRLCLYIFPLSLPSSSLFFSRDSSLFSKGSSPHLKSGNLTYVNTCILCLCHLRCLYLYFLEVYAAVKLLLQKRTKNVTTSVRGGAKRTFDLNVNRLDPIRRKRMDATDELIGSRKLWKL